MDLELSDDQLELDTVATAMLDQRAPLSVARAYLEGEGDATALVEEVAEMGWYAIGLDQDDPFGIPGLCLLARASGAHVAPIPLVDTAVAARLAAAVEGPSEAVTSLAAGEASAALAVLDADADWTLRGAAAVASTDGDGVLLNGTKAAVHHAAVVDVIVVLAELEGAVAAFFVTPGQDGVTVRPQSSIDPSAATHEVEMASVTLGPGQVLAGAEWESAASRAFAIGAVATAADAHGAASRALDLAIEYSKEREQFGRPIGQFQSLQQVMAEAHVTRETAWSTVLYAAAALEEDMPDALQAAVVAKAYVSTAARHVVEAALQVLGGVAFTWEYDAHLFQRRVLSAERRFGDTIQHQSAIATSLLEASAATASG